MKNLVFVVEDNPVQQKMLKFHFEQSLGEYEVQAFTHPDEMMGRLMEKPFAVVLDHFFGDNSAKTGLDYLKNIKKKSSVPVIYYTTTTDEVVKKQALKFGATEFITKDAASLVRLRTVLDLIHERKLKKKGLLSKLFNRG